MADPLSYLGGVVQGRYTPQRDRTDLETDLKYRTALAEAYARLAGAETDLHKGVFATWGNAANAYVSGIANIAKAMAEAGRADAEAMKAAAELAHVQRPVGTFQVFVQPGLQARQVGLEVVHDGLGLLQLGHAHHHALPLHVHLTLQVAQLGCVEPDQV